MNGLLEALQSELMSSDKFATFEAGDSSPGHAIRLAEMLAGHDWRLAGVDAQEGLWLVDEANRKAVHFAFARCGEDDEATQASAIILSMAGFDQKSFFLGSLADGQRHLFRR